MLYLFNSGYRTLYVRNVLNTLALPLGSTNEYRYRFRRDGGRSDGINIDPLQIDRLKALRPQTPVAIVFVDRFHKGDYYFHPLRMGSFRLARESNDYLFFRVQLGAYTYPRDDSDFNRVFANSLRPSGIPCLTENDPFNASDGWYAVLEESLFSQAEDFFTGDSAWARCVEKRVFPTLCG